MAVPRTDSGPGADAPQAGAACGDRVPSTRMREGGYFSSAVTASSMAFTCRFGLRSECTAAIEPDGAIT